MTCVSIVYKSIRQGCGINIFNKRLTAALVERGYTIKQSNLAIQPYEPSPNTIIHYVPSMWAKDDGALEQAIKCAKHGRIIVILHGMYSPRDNAYLQETLCPELHTHVYSLALNADTIIALSQSCKRTWYLWDNGDLHAKVVTFVHPGAYLSPPVQYTGEPYLFFGGVIRPKKNVMAKRLNLLFRAYRERGVNVWVHISNPIDQVKDLLVWRVTKGVLKDSEWYKIISQASVVLCPYETKIQCVSGVMAEAISLGSRVIATDFPFAREMERMYPGFVNIDDDLAKWPNLTLEVIAERLPRPDFTTWNAFADVLVQELA